MGSSAQNSSGVHWCRRRVKFNEVPEKVPEKVPGNFGAEPGQVQQGSGEGSKKVWEALVQSQVRFNRVPKCSEEGFGEGSGRLWCRARSGSTGFRRRFRKKVLAKVWEAWEVRFNRVPEKVPVKVWEAWAQSQVRFNGGSVAGSGEGLGGFGAEPGQV